MIKMRETPGQVRHPGFSKPEKPDLERDISVIPSEKRENPKMGRY
jgi:hypothetical protein